MSRNHRQDQQKRSLGNLSAISGTTARTSHNAQELAEMEVKEMLGVLQELADASSNMLAYLQELEAPDLYVNDIRALTLRLRNPRLERLTRVLELQKAVYGQDSFIDVPSTVRRLLGAQGLVDINDRELRPDNIFFMANLGTLFGDLVRVHLNPNNTRTSLESVDEDFPSAFISHLEIEDGQTESSHNTALIHATFEVALELRTQVYLSALTQSSGQPKTKAVELLSQIFWNRDKSLKGWNSLGLESQDLSENHRNMLQDRIEEISKTVSDGGSTGPEFADVVNAERISKMYPWIIFFEQALGWIASRYSEVKGEITAVGGAHGIQKRLEAETEKARAPKTIFESPRDKTIHEIQLNHNPSAGFRDPFKIDLTQFPIQKHKSKGGNSLKLTSKQVTSLLSPSLSRRADKSSRFTSADTINHYKARKSAGTANSLKLPPLDGRNPQIPDANGDLGREGTSDTNFNEQPTADATSLNTVAADEGWQPDNLDDEHSSQGSAEKQRLLVVEMHNKEIAEQNKEDIPQPSVAPIRKSRAFVDAQPGAESLSFESQDSSSQNQTRPISDQPIRQQPGYRTSLRNRKIASEPGDDEFEDDSRAKNSEPPVRSRTQTIPERHPPVSQQRQQSTHSPCAEEQRRSHSPSSLTQLETYKTANGYSKSDSRLRTASRAQTRTPWSDEETDRLLFLIQKHGISWSLLKDKDGENGVLKNRDQTGIRDKARNMKIDYLK